MFESRDDSSDGVVIAEVLSGQTERFAVIVERYQRALLRFAKSRLGNEDLAEDATQESFLCAYKSLHRYDSRYSFRTWLWTIVLNQCRRAYHKSLRLAQAEIAGAHNSRALESQTSRGDSPDAALLVKERAQRLESLLGRMPRDQADALRLRFFGGLKYHEIADAMGCSLSTAKNRVRWGLTKLSQQLVPGEML